MLSILITLIITICLPTGSSEGPRPPPHTDKSNCNLISKQYFTWLSEDGSLSRNLFSDGLSIQAEYLEVLSTECNTEWQPLPFTKGCQFCNSSAVLVCEGSEVKSIPTADSLPTTNFTMFKMTGVGLLSLLPNSFTGLAVDHLVIENSNLSTLAATTFAGVQSIKYLHIKNNNIDFLESADYLFEDIKDLKVVELKGNGLRVLSSANSANLSSLEVFSLADNPIRSLNVQFLQNSGLRLLDLRNVTFGVNEKEIESGGFSSLPNSLSALDLHGANISINSIEEILKAASSINVLNLGNLKSDTKYLFAKLSHVRKSLQYLSLQGTDLQKTTDLEEKRFKSLVTTKIRFHYLEELNLKNCSLKKLGSWFKLFPKLTVLSLSENPLLTLDLKLFSLFPSLSYLEFSSNILKVVNGSTSTARNLRAVDFSFTEMDLQPTNVNQIFNVMQNLQNISLCDARLSKSTVKGLRILQNLSSLKLLDLSGTVQNNRAILPDLNDLFLLSNLSITELHLSRNGITFLPSSMFYNLQSLKVLNLSKNMIKEIRNNVFLPSIESLTLSENLVTTWYYPIFNQEPKLTTMDLSKNQLTYITDAMFSDFLSVEFLNVNDNPIMCDNRVVEMVCKTIEIQNTSTNWSQNQCYDQFSLQFVYFTKPQDCQQYYEEAFVFTNNFSTPQSTEFSKLSLEPSFLWLYILIGSLVLAGSIGTIIYWKWWTIRCYVYRYFSLKKAQILRKGDEALTRPDILYDVFVSYSDIDRSWVLDYLVPNLEADGDTSLCFHERDFQVGLSILENIIECMDRSNCLLLIVSSAFVRSKWCQFEMHLAQYRLIETFRDQLVLVLLEDIPRKLRPQTLHHMMMTKTYLIWPREPCKEEARELFWKRLKRALKPGQSYIFDI